MLENEIRLVNVSQYMYENRDSIPIIDTVILDDFLFGRLDILLNRYYKNKMEYLPLLYDFNKITDPTSLNIGRLIDIPDFDYLIDVVSKQDTEYVAGVSKSMEPTKPNSKQSSSSNVTVGLPKLNVKLKPANYNSDTGEMTY